MKFTFGIITDGNSDNNLNLVIDSIEKQYISTLDYEIIVIGNSKVDRKNTLVMPFDDSIKSKWITRKKNLITKNAKYENIVYMHDYIALEDNWYEGYLSFGEEFKVCTNVLLNADNTRWRDWVIWPHNLNEMDDIVNPSRECIFSYDITHLSKYQYISGSYWIAKKHVMIEFPLDEKLSWGGGEDVSWSKEVREKYDFSININSTCKCLKMKNKPFEIASEEMNEKLRNFNKLK